MKKYLFILLTLLFCLPAAFAQNNDRAKMMEDLQKFKIDYLAKEMQLSEKEKAEFAPVYKEYDNERRQAGSEVRKFERNLKKDKNASEADYQRLADLQQSARDKDSAIVNKYDTKFKSFLSAKQIYLMRQGEEKFLEKMKDMKKNHRPGGQPGAKNSHKNENKHKGKPADDCTPFSLDL